MIAGNRVLSSLVRVVAVLMMAAAVTGCAQFYVDGAVKDIPADQYAKPARPAPVQLFFEFQTKGVANAKATEFLKTRVADQVKASGLFSQVTDTASDAAGTLSITLNNVPLSDDAFSKGFVTGLTFGLAGSQVSDGYICTARYTPAGSQTAVQKSARHAIHTTVGAAAAPGNATKASDIQDAVFTMARQVTSQVLNDLSKDPEFKR